MNFQKIALKEIIINQNEHLFAKLQLEMFSKINKNIFKIIEHFYNKYHKLPTIDDIVGIIESKIPNDKVEIYKSYLQGLKKVTSSLSENELIDELKKNFTIQKIETKLPELLDSIQKKDIDKTNSLLLTITDYIYQTNDFATKDIKEIEVKQSTLSTIDTFIPTLNKQGLQLTGLVIVGAGSGLGKSIFSLNQAIHAYEQGLKVSIMSLELPETQILLRLYSMVNSTPYNELLSKPKEKLNVLINKWKHNYFKDDHFFINYFRYNPQQLKKTIINDIKKGVKLFVIDYLNLVETQYNEEEWRSLSRLVKELHDMAMKYGVVIVSPTQVNLSEDKNKKVTITTRGSRELEYSSSVMLLIHQNKDEYKENIARIIVMKSRVSIKFSVVVKTNFNVMRFEDMNIVLED